MTTAQEGRQAAVRAYTGTSLDYNGDWEALFDLNGISPEGGFNGRFLAWINLALGTSYTELNGAMAAYAAMAGATNWSSMSTVPQGGPSAVQMLGGATYTIDGSVGQTYSAPAGMTSIQWYRRALASPYAMTSIAGATASTYVSQAGDIGSRLVARGTLNSVITDAISLMPVLDLPVLMDDYESLTGRTAQGTGTVLSLDTSDKLRGTSSLVVTTGTASGNNGSGTTPTLDPSQLGVVVVAAKRGPDAFTQYTESIVKGGQSISTNGSGDSTATASPEWRYLFFDTTPTFVGATSGVTTVRDWQNLPVGTPGIIAKYDAKFSKAKGRAFILPSFDDGYDSTDQLAGPYLDGLGIQAITYYAPLLLDGGGAGASKRGTVAQLLTRASKLWDIGCDSGMSDEGFSGLTPSQALAQLDQVQAWNAANIGTRGNEFFCYSMGSFTDDQGAAIIASGRYKMGRGIIPGSFHTRFGILPGIQRIYPSMGFTSDTPANYATQLANAKALIDSAVATGAVVSFHHHYQTDTVTAIGTPWTAVFQPLYTYIAQLRDQGLLDVGTPTQLVARDGIGARFPI